MFNAWPVPLVFVLYFVLAGGVVFCTIKASNHINEIDKKTNIGSAFLGGILLAAVTSLPELITSITSVVWLPNPKPELAIGNIFGSNLFNMMILGIADIIFIKKTFTLHATKGNRFSNLCTIIMYLVVAIPCVLIRFVIKPDNFFGIGNLWFSLISVGILIVYILNVWLSRKVEASEEVEEANDDSSEAEPKEKASVKKNVWMFVLWSLCLVIISILITNATDAMNDALKLDASFAGALFLGIATSLPELTSTINLVRLNNFGAAVGDITGSSLFNITIISIVDLITKKNIYSYLYAGTEQNSIILLLLGLFSVLILMYILLRKKSKNKVLYIIPSVLLVSSYFVYILFSTL